MSGSESDDSCDDVTQLQLLQQLDKFVSGKMGLPLKDTKVPLVLAPELIKKSKIHQNKAKSKERTRKKPTKDIQHGEELAENECSAADTIIPSTTKTEERKRKIEKIKEENEKKLNKKKKKKRKKNKAGSPETGNEVDNEDIIKDTVQPGVSKKKKASYATTEKEPSIYLSTANQNTQIDKIGDTLDNEMEMENDDIGGSDDNFDDDVSDFGDDVDAFSDDSGSLSGTNTNTTSKCKSQKHLNEIKSSLGLTKDDFDAYNNKKKSELSRKISPAVVSRYGVIHRPPPEVVVFTPHQKKQKEEEAEVDERELLDLDKARWDVRKLGTSALRKRDKQKSTVAMLVKLGAEPPKPGKMHYKHLMKMRIQEEQKFRQKLKEREEFGDTGLIIDPLKALKQKRAKKKHRLGQNEVKGSAFGQIGRDRGGTHVVRTNDIKRIGGGSGKRG